MGSAPSKPENLSPGPPASQPSLRSIWIRGQTRSVGPAMAGAVIRPGTAPRPWAVDLVPAGWRHYELRSACIGSPALPAGRPLFPERQRTFLGILTSVGWLPDFLGPGEGFFHRQTGYLHDHPLAGQDR